MFTQRNTRFETKPSRYDDRYFSHFAAARSMLGLDILEIAESLGFSESQVSRWLSGKSKITQPVIRDLVRFFSSKGVLVNQTGVVRIEADVQKIEGHDAYVKLLYMVLDYVSYPDSTQPDNRPLVQVGFGCDEYSPAPVLAVWQQIYDKGSKVLSLISEDDNYIIGNLEDYRHVPKQYFAHGTMINFNNVSARCYPCSTVIALHYDPIFVNQNKLIFNHFWDFGSAPILSTAPADERLRVERTLLDQFDHI